MRSIDVVKDNYWLIQFYSESVGEEETLRTDKGKIVKIPFNCSLSVVIDMINNKLRLRNYQLTYSPLDDFNENLWADKLTHKIILDNAVRFLWSENKGIAQLTEPEELFLAHSLKDTDRVSTKGNHNKALIFSTWCFALNNIPRGFQSEWLEMKLGMDNSYITQIINRNSVKYSDLQAEKKTADIWKPKKFEYKDKPVYFVRHSDSKQLGGYMPQWLVDEYEEFLNKEFNPTKDIIGWKYTLNSESTGAIQ
jgi:hypothetical protein